MSKPDEISITHYASTADRWGDMCIANLGNRGIFMIDGGKTCGNLGKPPGDVEKLFNEIRGKQFDFVLSHWHDDHYGYIKYKTRGQGVPKHIYYGFVIPSICEFGNYPPNGCFGPNEQKNVANGVDIYASALQNPVDQNDNSMVTVIRVGAVNYFSFGDATKETLNFTTSMGSIFNQIQGCTNPIIKLPHHGSHENCQAVFDRLNPKKCYRFIISGHGGDNIERTIDMFLVGDDNKNRVFLVGKYKSESINGFVKRKQNMYGDRFIYTNYATVNTDGTITVTSWKFQK